MNRYIDTLNEEIRTYFNILCKNDYPKFIDKYIDTEELQRLSGIGQFCGCDYTKIHNVKYWYSRLDHSIACALMTWNFTKDKTQTLAALFHDLGTPVFSHCIDYLLGDFINQESSEKSVYNVINNSKKIKEYLIHDDINILEIEDISKFSIVENEKPKICVDRLDGVLHTCLIWQNFWNIEQVREIYNDIVVLNNENGEDEIGFKNINLCEVFFQGVFKYSIELQKNEDKFTMQFIADCLKLLIDSNKISLEQLYVVTEREVVDTIKENNKNWEVFANATSIQRADIKPENNYCVLIDTKKRYVIPLVLQNGKCLRLNEVSEYCEEKLKEYLNYNDSKYSYIKDIYRI